MEYFPRIADVELQRRLNYIGAVLIEGPKWCGKTTTALQQARSVLRLQNPDFRDAYLATAETRPSNLLKGETPRLIDPSIAVASLGLSPGVLEMDLKTFGFIFECMAIRDLRAYSQALNGEISCYHDRYDLEADAVLHLDNGQYALIEFKLGSAEIESGARHLLEIRDLVRKHNEREVQTRLREPDLLIVITGGPLAYTRPDGVRVVPLACLKD